MKLKVCGLNDPVNIKEIASLSPDFMGFIFYPLSKRCIDESFDPEILKSLPPQISKVGVFVDASINEIIGHVNKYGLDYVQLHGNEDHLFCARLFIKHIKIIKVFRIDTWFNFYNLEAFVPFCSFFLFDKAGELPGGNGIKFSWGVLNKYQVRLPFMLSGGIGPDDIQQINSFDHEMCFAIDINSKFEIKQGVKDVKLVRDFKSKIMEFNMNRNTELNIVKNN